MGRVAHFSGHGVLRTASCPKQSTNNSNLRRQPKRFVTANAYITNTRLKKLKHLGLSDHQLKY